MIILQPRTLGVKPVISAFGGRGVGVTDKDLYQFMNFDLKLSLIILFGSVYWKIFIFFFI